MGTYMRKTFLETFIEKKVHEHLEPSCKGMRHDDTARFSRKKFMATLYFLTAEKQISIAMEQGISYGLLRKWKTEGPFKTLVRKHCIEFADAFITYVLERHVIGRNVNGEHLDPVLEDTAVRTTGEKDDTFRDSSDYSPDLLAEILRAVVAYAQRAERNQSVSEAFTVFSSFLALISPVVHGKAMRKIARNAGIDLTALARGLKLGVVERVKRIITKPIITAGEREEAYHLLTELETMIGEASLQ